MSEADRSSGRAVRARRLLRHAASLFHASRLALAVLVAGIGISTFAVSELREDISRRQAAQLADRARATTNMFATVAQEMGALLATGGVVAQATHGDPAAFRHAVSSRLARVLLSNAVLYDVSGGVPLELAWAGRTPPRLAGSFTAAEQAHLLDAARSGKTLVVGRRESATGTVLAVAAGAQPRGRYAVYGEIAEPRAVSFGGSNGLRFAFYVGRETPRTLLATNATELPICGRRLVRKLDLGGFAQQPLLVYAATAPASYDAAAPWLGLGGGILVSLLLAAQVEGVRRRRDAALDLVADLEEKNAELDRQGDLNRHQALHDALTGLPNRTLFTDRIERAAARYERLGEASAVVLVDLDHFKEVNDTLGHEWGDRLLRVLGERLTETLREIDTVARLGGDEFGILLAGVETGADALLTAAKVAAAIAEPVEVDGLTLAVDASFGAALLPRDGTDVDSLMRHADVALYRSKAEHMPTLYSSEHDHHSPKRLKLVAGLRHAIESGEIRVVYQPQARLEDGRVQSVEALVRWQHPELGLVQPGNFIPFAEHTGMIRPLTRFVLDQALTQCRDWLDRGFEIGVAVNVSARDLLDARFRDEVLDALRRARVPAQLLELEITENTILSDSSRARMVIMSLHGHGIRFAIDDFGAGHSSLSYLKRLPVQSLKIDKSFVLGMSANEDDDVIVRSTIDLGHNLRLTVVAEGVETVETRKRLLALGCDVVQGFELARPLPPGEVERLFDPPAEADTPLAASARS